MRALWRGAVLAESSETIVIDGNHYFPPDSVRREFLRESKTHTFCGWKGDASYYDILVDGEVNADAAWRYIEPMEAAQEIKNYIAFWKGVDIVEVAEQGK